MKRLFVLILLLASTCRAQYVAMGGFNKGSTSGVSTTAIVTHAQGPSTEGGAVTSLVSGTTTCSAYTICFPLPDAVLSGNGVVVVYRYHASSAETATATDDQSNTYTCITEVHEATHNAFVGGCYSLNLTNSPRVIKVTLNSGCGASGCTQGQVMAGQLYNVTSFDTSANGSNTGSATTLSTSALTTTAGNDLVYQGVFVTNPTNTSSTSSTIPAITFGSGWNGVAADTRDGASAQWKVITSAGSVTPSETAASGVSYASVALAFKSGNQGTLPSGEYIVCRGSYNSQENFTTTSIPMQMPCMSAGDLIYSSLNGGGTTGTNPDITSVTDSSNTWTKCVPQMTTTGAVWNEGWCAFNATSSSTEAPTFTMNWHSNTTADVSFWWNVIAGASTTAIQSFVMSGNTLQGNQTSGAAGSFTMTTGQTYQPQASTSLTMMEFNQASNTEIALSAPSTLFDATINGGENLSGPWQQDQNGAWGHYLASGTNASQTWTMTETSATQVIGQWGGTIISFPSSGAVWTPQNVATTGTSVTNISISITTLSASDSLIVGAGFYNGGTGFTISKVCLDGNSTCSTGTAFSEFVNARSASTAAQPGTGVWHLFSGISKAAHTVTIVASGSATNLEGVVYEVANISTEDVASHTNNGSVSGGNASGPSVTTTGNPGFAIAIFGVSSGCTTVPATGNAYTAGGGIFANTNDGYMSLVSTSAAAHSPACADSSGTFNSSNASFK